MLIPAEQLKISGITPYTAIDYPGCFSAVVFVQGCPWRCRYCHNPHMQPREFDERYLHSSWQELMQLLQRRQGLLDAVVFSGGEPTLDPALPEAMQRVREMGYKVGLHTSGCYPRHLKAVLPYADWVGLDVKHLLDDTKGYQWIVGVDSYDVADGVKECIHLLLDSKVAFECRTTAHPSFLPEDKLLKLARMLSDLGVNDYALQVYRQPPHLDLPFDKVGYEYPESEVTDEIKSMFAHFELRRE